jgi:hypothetical protein
MPLCIKKQKIPHPPLTATPKHITKEVNKHISTRCTYEYFSFPPDDRTNILIYITTLNIITHSLIERRHFQWQHKNVRNFNHRLVPISTAKSGAWIRNNLRAQI